MIADVDEQGISVFTRDDETPHYFSMGNFQMGELTLELGHGDKKVLKSGDCYVQNGARHAWHNHTDEKAVLGAS